MNAKVENLRNGSRLAPTSSSAGANTWRRALRTTLWRSKVRLAEIMVAALCVEVLSLLPPLAFTAVLDHVLPARAVATLIALVAVLLGAALLRAALAHRNYLSMTSLVLRCETVLNDRVTGRTLAVRASQPAVARLDPGAVAPFTHVGTTRTELETALVGATSVIGVVLMLTVLGFISWVLASVVVVAAAAQAFANRVGRTGFKRAKAANIAANIDAGHTINPMLRGVVPSDAEELSRLGTRSNATYTRFRAARRRMVETAGGLSRIGEAATLGVGAYLVIDGALTVGAFVACYILAGRARDSLGRVASGIGARKRMGEALDALERTAPPAAGDAGPAMRTSVPAPSPWATRGLIALTAAGLLTASLIPLDVVASAPGQVVPRGKVKPIRSIESGLAASVPVEDGRKVAAGEVLLALDARQINAKLSQVNAKQNESDTILRGARDELTLLGELTPMVERRVRDQRRLMENDNTTLLNMDTAVRDAVEHRRRVADAREQIARSLTARAGLDAEREGLLAERDRLVMRAPVAGVVANSAVRAEGATVVAGEEVMRVVPSDEQPIVEARLANRDVAFVRPGQHAVVKLESLPFHIYGAIDATVEHVAADSVAQPDGTAAYPVRLVMRDLGRTSTGHPVELVPGMAVTADVITDERTIAGYLLAPILRGADATFRER